MRLLFSCRPGHFSQLSCLIRDLHPGNKARYSTGSRAWGFDPHAYTSGRWLRRDHLERKARYIHFDFAALSQKVVELCPGARSIQACRKLEGGFNRVFIFTLDTGDKIVAKLPFRHAGPAKWTTLSEVATVRYLQARTQVPIPKILDYNHNASDERNTVGSEYIIMEHARGVSLEEKWHQMAGDQQVRCIDSIYRTMKQAVDLEFPAFGSIYHDALDFANREALGDGYCVGPHCGSRYWDCTPSERRYYHYVKQNPGPWKSLTAYCDGLVDAGLSRVPAVDTEAQERPIYHGSPETHLTLLDETRLVLKQLAMDTRIIESSQPLLFHPDLHMRNIFVAEDDSTTVTGIIDWQSASIEPAFWYADEVADFATGNEICAKAFDLTSRFCTPKLAAPRLQDENLFRPLRYCWRTWKDGAVALRHDMIETARIWDKLELPGHCPYPLPSLEEQENHKKACKLFEAAQQLRTELASLLGIQTDGWVPVDRWEATRLAHRELFDGMLQAVLENEDPNDDEPVRDEATLRSIWPFDLD
ncbi:kinase-like domain-containing protein [Aspergillus unguis]